jgi:hypothetical protein
VGTQAHHLLVLGGGESRQSGPLPATRPCLRSLQRSRHARAARSQFGSDTNQTTIGNSNYNSLQIMLRHAGGPLQLLAAYTFSKSLDQSSNLGEEVNPLNPSLSTALSAFDIRHNFVVSYSYQIPHSHGWEFSGITRFSSGLPVTLINYGDNSLLGAEPNGINNYGVDEPDVAAGPLN